MNFSSKFFLLLISISLLKFVNIRAELQLEAIYINSTLPYPQDNVPSDYNGEDSIYIFATEPESKRIISFSISSETISTVGTLPGYYHSGGFVEMDISGNYFYFGAGLNGDDIYKWDRELNTTRFIRTYPSNLRLPHLRPSKESNIVHLFGSSTNYILSCDMGTSIVACSSKYMGMNVWGEGAALGNKVYIFTATRIVEVDLESLTASAICPEIQLGDTHPKVFTSVSYIYGFESMDRLWLTGGNVFRFDPSNCEMRNVSVGNFPKTGYGYYTLPSANYIPQLGRIYFFGGAVATGANGVRTVDEIFYIDLPEGAESGSTTTCTISTDESTTEMGESSTEMPQEPSCVSKPDGIYPHPLDCAMYFVCLSENIHIFSCPDPYLFNHILLTCDTADNVDCERN